MLQTTMAATTPKQNKPEPRPLATCWCFKQCCFSGFHAYVSIVLLGKRWSLPAEKGQVVMLTAEMKPKKPSKIKKQGTNCIHFFSVLSQPPNHLIGGFFSPKSLELFLFHQKPTINHPNQLQLAHPNKIHPDTKTSQHKTSPHGVS